MLTGVLLKPKKTRSIEMTLTFSIIDTQYDLVIGLQDIRKYDLTRRCRELFTTPPINNPKDGSHNPSERLAKVSTPENLLECHSTSPARPIEVAPVYNTHTSPSILGEEIEQLVQKRKVSRVIEMCAKQSLGARTFVSPAKDEADCESLVVPEAPLHSATLFALTVDPDDDMGANQPVSDSTTRVSRIRISDVIGEAGVDPFDEMLDNVDNAQFLPPESENNVQSQFRCPPDSQVLFPGDEENTQKARILLQRYKHIFTKFYQNEPAKVPPMEIKVDHEKWHRRENCQPPRHQSVEREQVLRTQYAKMVDAGVVRPCPEAKYYSHALVVPKPNLDKETGEKQWRNCVDFKNLNEASITERWPLPVIHTMLQEIGNTRPKPRVFAKADFTHGFHQSPLALSSQIYTAFIVSFGIFCWRRVPMGLKGAPSYFQNVMATVLGSLLYQICRLYIDDVLIWGDSNAALVENTEKVLERLSSHHIYLNPDKFYLGCPV